MNIGTAVVLMMRPSALSMPNTEQTAMILLMHTILPIAPPTDCRAKISGTDMPVALATEYCTAPKVCPYGSEVRGKHRPILACGTG